MLTQKQIDILDDIVIGNWELKSDGTVDVAGDVRWYYYGDHESMINFQGIKFGHVTRSFDCSNCKKLESLEGSPIFTVINFDLDYCFSLRTLESISQDIVGDLWIRKCKSLHSLKGIGKIGGKIHSECVPFIEGFDDLTEEEQKAIRGSNEVNILAF